MMPTHDNQETSLFSGNPNVPIVDQTKQNSSTTTPQWMIMMDDLLGSTIQGTTPDPTPSPDKDIDFTNCSELYGWLDKQAVLTKGNTGSEYLSNAAVQQSPVTVVIPIGSYGPTLQNYMNHKINIAKIHIILLGNIGSLKLPVQIISYTVSKIESYEQSLDKITINFRPAMRQDTFKSYSQDGTAQGNNVSSFDYTTGESVGMVPGGA